MERRKDTSDKGIHLVTPDLHKPYARAPKQSSAESALRYWRARAERFESIATWSWLAWAIFFFFLVATEVLNISLPWVRAL